MSQICAVEILAIYLPKSVISTVKIKLNNIHRTEKSGKKIYITLLAMIAYSAVQSFTGTLLIMTQYIIVHTEC